MYFLRMTVCPFIKSAYIDLTVKKPDIVIHTKLSG
jgi:hypothetical protein